MRQRSRIDIIRSLLRTASSDGATKTRLMYGAYLSSRQLKEYLGFMMERGLLTYDEVGQTYKLTEKGLEFLNAADRVEKLLSLEQESQQDKALFAELEYRKEMDQST